MLKLILCSGLSVFISSTTFAKDNLVIATMQEWDVVHPISYQTAATEAIMHMMQRQMVYRDISGKVLPEVAVDIPSLKNKKAKIITEQGRKKIVAEWQIGRAHV